MTALRVWLSDPNPASRRQARLGQLWLAWRRIRRNRLAMAGLVIVAVLVLVAAFAPWIAPHDPLVQDLSRRLLPPGTPGNLLGTDDFGRDILSRIMFGARITLYIIALVAVTAPVLGLLIGTVAGYFGGWVDATLMRRRRSGRGSVRGLPGRQPRQFTAGARCRKGRRGLCVVRQFREGGASWKAGSENDPPTGEK